MPPLHAIHAPARDEIRGGAGVVIEGTDGARAGSAAEPAGATTLVAR